MLASCRRARPGSLLCSGLRWIDDLPSWPLARHLKAARGLVSIGTSRVPRKEWGDECLFEGRLELCGNGLNELPRFGRRHTLSTSPTASSSSCRTFSPKVSSMSGPMSSVDALVSFPASRRASTFSNRISYLAKSYRACSRTRPVLVVFSLRWQASRGVRWISLRGTRGVFFLIDQCSVPSEQDVCGEEIRATTAYGFCDFNWVGPIHHPAIYTKVGQSRIEFGRDGSAGKAFQACFAAFAVTSAGEFVTSGSIRSSLRRCL